jgi:hypothetical protein
MNIKTRMFLSDYRTKTGWRHNAHIFTEYFMTMSDELIAQELERIEKEKSGPETRLVVFMELYGDLLTLDEMTDIQEGRKRFVGVARMVVVNDELYEEWLKPEAVS